MIRSEISTGNVRGITHHAGSYVEGPLGPPDEEQPTSGSSGPGGPDGLNALGSALYHWVINVRELLDDLQKALERAHDAASGQDRRELSRLLDRTRDCQFKAPGPGMIRGWLRFLINSTGLTKV